MKKTLFIISIMLFATLVMADDHSARAEAAKSYSEILPAETMVVVSIPDMAELKALIASPEVEGALIKTGLKEKALGILKEADKEFSSKVKMSLFDIYDDLAGGMTFALLDLDIPKKEASFVFMVGMKGGKAMADSYLGRFVNAAKEQEKELTFETIAGLKMINIDNHAYLGSWGDGLVMVSQKAGLEALMANGPKLASHEYFTTNAAKVGLNSGVVAYFNFEKFYNMLAPTVKEPQAQLGFKLLGLDKILSASLHLPLDDDGLFKAMVHAPGYDGIIPMIFSSKAVSHHAASVAADHADSIYAISIHKPLQIFESFLALMPEVDPNFDKAQFDQQLAGVEQTLGLSIRDDLLAPFGEYIAFTMYLNDDADMDLSAGPMAVLKMLNFDLAFKLDDPAKFINAMDIMVTQSAGSLVPEAYKDAIIYSVAAPGMPVEACATIYNNQLKFCLYSADKAKMLIDKVRAGKTLANFADYKNTVKPVPANSNAFTYLNKSYMAKWGSFANAYALGLDETQMKEFKNLSKISKELSVNFPNLYSFSQVIPQGLYIESAYPMKKIAQYIIIELIKLQYAFGGMNKYEHQADTGRDLSGPDKLVDPR